ncbi:MAG: hypothetical protein EOR34_28585 [Mesorhizobium sp.]|nr:hypothetical protein [Mesorhizobium sp.]RWJ66376.1 MAG: hypothetical protein EOR34_28585 [Mesorhizobium sp.]
MPGKSKTPNPIHERIRRKARGGPSLSEAVKEVLARGDYTGKPHGAPDLAEEEHFVRCPMCGQAFDMRSFAEVMHHTEPGHKPLDLDS